MFEGYWTRPARVVSETRGWQVQRTQDGTPILSFWANPKGETPDPRFGVVTPAPENWVRK